MTILHFFDYCNFKITLEIKEWSEKSKTGLKNKNQTPSDSKNSFT